MGDGKQLVLVVDDEAPVGVLVGRALAKKFEVVCLKDGYSCLEFVGERLPDTILMDVRMPGMNGLEACRKLRENEATKDIPVIFVSGLDSVEERMAGFEAGGDDYIVKPFELKLLREKVAVSVANYEKIIELKQSSGYASEVAMQAMTTSGELGVVLEFYRTSFESRSYQALAEGVCSALCSYGLNSSVQITLADGETIEADNSGVVRPLEMSLLQKMRFKDRIIDFGARTIINYPHISLLVKNMPIEDEAKYGRFKDNLAPLLEGASARVEALIAMTIVARQKVALQGLVDKIKIALKDVQGVHEAHKERSVSTVEGLISHMEAALLAAGLTEEQEVSLISMVEKSAGELISIYEQGLSISEKFADIISEIESVTSGG